jgi:pyruvate dehydrogenase E2 component (dihydrolipoamide acetyltransferase)
VTTDIVMPRLSDTMESGVVGTWLRNEGDFVNKGDPIVEIETEKATTELLAECEGFLSVLAEEGGSVATGGLIGRIVASSDDVRKRESAAESPGSSRPRATPLARKLAAQAGIDLLTIGSGSGPEGRIHRIDIERLLTASTPTPLRPPYVDSEDRVVEPSRVQALIAKRMTQAKQQVPHYYLTSVATMTEALSLKRVAAALRPPVRLSVSDITLFACARALAEHPSVNASWVDGRIVRRQAVNVGFAVALDGDELVVPVITGADGLSLAQLAATRRDLVTRARARKLKPSELEDGTFTLSSLGSYRVTEFHAIINPPESGILAVGQIEDRLVVVDGQAVIQPQMTISLSADHRVYSGAAAAAFISTILQFLEHPALGLLDGS